MQLKEAQVFRRCRVGRPADKGRECPDVSHIAATRCSLKPRTVMSSIMRARSALTGRWEGPEVIRGSFLELKVAGPSMLGIGCLDRHALPRINLIEMRRPRRVLPSRASGFVRRRYRAVACDVPERVLLPLSGPTGSHL